MFAIITFRKSGPIKTWSAMRATNVHNARTKPLDHAVPGAPLPRHLIGTRDLVADVKRRLDIAKIDPDRLRKNGVIAYEAILTASAEFFEVGNEVQRAARLAAWTKAQVAWADDRYGPLRIASMVLHQDEKTPHIHLVVLPLELKIDRRRSKPESHWSLVGCTISGPGKFDQVQDAYAAAMAPFGLIRGLRGSARKHEPVPVYLARMAAKEQDVDQVRAMMVSETEALAEKAGELERAARNFAAAALRQDREEEDRRRRLDWDRDAMLAAIAADRRKVAVARLALEKERAGHAARIAAEESAIARDRDVLRQELEAIHALRDQIRHDADAARTDAAKTSRAMQAAIELQQSAEQDRAAAEALRTHARTVADKIETHRKQLLPTLAAAAEFRKKIAALGDRPVTAPAAAVMSSTSALRTASLTVQPPELELRPNVLAAYAAIRNHAAAMGR